MKKIECLECEGTGWVEPVRWGVWAGGPYVDYLEEIRCPECEGKDLEENDE